MLLILNYVRWVCISSLMLLVAEGLRVVHILFFWILSLKLRFQSHTFMVLTEVTELLCRFGKQELFFFVNCRTICYFIYILHILCVYLLVLHFNMSWGPIHKRSYDISYDNILGAIHRTLMTYLKIKSYDHLSVVLRHWWYCKQIN